MSNEEQLLEYWRKLPSEAQHQVLKFTRLLQTNNNPEGFGAPDHLTIRSREHLDQLLQEGLESLDRGEGIELTDQWWEQERQNLIAKQLGTREQ